MEQDNSAVLQEELALLENAVGASLNFSASSPELVSMLDSPKLDLSRLGFASNRGVEAALESSGGSSMKNQAGLVVKAAVAGGDKASDVDGSGGSSSGLHDFHDFDKALHTPTIPRTTSTERLLLKMSPRERSIDMDARAEAESVRQKQLRAILMRRSHEETSQQQQQQQPQKQTRTQQQTQRQKISPAGKIKATSVLTPTVKSFIKGRYGEQVRQQDAKGKGQPAHMSTVKVAIPRPGYEYNTLGNPGSTPHPRNTESRSDKTFVAGRQSATKVFSSSSSSSSTLSTSTTFPSPTVEEAKKDPTRLLPAKPERKPITSMRRGTFWGSFPARAQGQHHSRKDDQDQEVTLRIPGLESSAAKSSTSTAASAATPAFYLSGNTGKYS